jgi:hypothetical protein
MSLSDKAMLVDLTFHFWGARKHDKKISMEEAESHNSDITMGQYNKQLIPRQHFNKMYTVAGRIESHYKKLTLPWLDNGQRILSSTGYFKFLEKIRELQPEWDEAVEEFTRLYPIYVEEAKAKSPNFEEADYPKNVSDRFSFTWDISPLPIADDFRVVLGDEEVEAIRQSITDTQNRAVKQALVDVAQRIQQVVGHMANKLKEIDGTGNEGKSGIFRDSLVGNVRELADIIPDLNIMDDQQLADIGNTMAKKLCAFTPDQLRQSEEARQFVRKQADDILKKVGAFI